MLSLRNNTGFSLVSMIVAIGLMGILMVAFVSMLEVQNKELRNVKQKISTLSLNQLLLRIIQNPKNCSCHFDLSLNTVSPGPLTIDTTVPVSPEINLQNFRNGCDFTTNNNILVAEGLELPNSSGIKIRSVKVKNIIPTGTTDEFSANLVIDYDESTLARSLAPINIGLIFKIDSVIGSANARPIISCSSGVSAHIQKVKSLTLVTTTAPGAVDCATNGEIKSSDSTTYVPSGEKLIIDASGLISVANNCGMQLDMTIVGPGLNKRFRVGYVGLNTNGIGNIANTVSNRFVVGVFPGASYTITSIYFVKSHVGTGNNGNTVGNTDVVITDITR